MESGSSRREDCPICGAIITLFDWELHDQCNVCGHVYSEEDSDFFEEEGYPNSEVESGYLEAVARAMKSPRDTPENFEENFDGESMTDSLNFGNRNWETGEILE